MMPIVDGLNERYGSEVAVIKLNALDRAAGEQAFGLSGLPGHPSYLLLLPGGEEQWRGVGLQTAADLENILLGVLEGR